MKCEYKSMFYSSMENNIFFNSSLIYSVQELEQMLMKCS